MLHGSQHSAVGLDVSEHTIFVIGQSHSIEVRVKTGCVQSVSWTHALRVASWWGVCREIWLQILRNWRGKLVMVCEVLRERS